MKIKSIKEFEDMVEKQKEKGELFDGEYDIITEAIANIKFEMSKNKIGTLEITLDQGDDERYEIAEKEAEEMLIRWLSDYKTYE